MVSAVVDELTCSENRANGVWFIVRALPYATGSPCASRELREVLMSDSQHDRRIECRRRSSTVPDS